MTNWYATQAGIIAATAIAVSVIKRALGNVKYANAVPTWTYAVAIACLLTFLAIHEWHTLPGDLWSVISQTALAAGASSGFYEWVNRPTASLAQSAVAAGVVVHPDNAPARDVAAGLIPPTPVTP